MWNIEGKAVDIVPALTDMKKINSVSVSCFTILPKNMKKHQQMQLGWYLRDRHIGLPDIEQAIELLNWFNDRNISYRLKYNPFRTKKRTLYTNFVVYTKWYLPTKRQYINQRIKILVWQLLQYL